MNKKILIILLLLITACTDKNKDSKALSHCADIKFINTINKNPEILLTNASAMNIINEVKRRDKAIKVWAKENINPKDLMAIGDLRAKVNNLADPMNIGVFASYSDIIGQLTDVTSLNAKTSDWKLEHKKTKFINYSIFYSDCLTENKTSKVFIEKYYKWQEQDITNLSEAASKYFNDIFNISKFYPHTNVYKDHFSKVLQLVY